MVPNDKHVQTRSRAMTHCNRFAMLVLLSGLQCVQAGEQWQITLHEKLNQAWTNELLSYPFSAPEGVCHPASVTLAGPDGRLVPVQFTEAEYWPGAESVRTAKLCFIADLAPLAEDSYVARMDRQSDGGERQESDLKVTEGPGQVEITTAQFGARLLLGEQTYPEPVPSDQVPAPVIALRLADGSWFGGSSMYGPAKLKGYSALLTDSGPVFARVAFRYTYDNDNTLDLTLQIAAGDNTIRAETNVREHQPDDGFRWNLSRGLPPLIFHVRNEGWLDRPVFQHGYATGSHHGWDWWREIPLQDYTGPTKRNHWTDVAGRQAMLVTSLTPWEDWFTSFTRTLIRLQLENTTRELQIRSLDAGAWVEPRTIAEVLGGDPDPAKGAWTNWGQKLLPLVKEPHGDISLQVNAAMGKRKWLVSDCLFAVQWKDPFMSEPPTPEARPTIGYRLNDVKDMVLAWPEGQERHPRLFVGPADLEAFRQSAKANPTWVEGMHGLHGIAAYLVSGDPETAKLYNLVRDLRDLLSPAVGPAFNCPRSIFTYDALIDSPLIPESERTMLRARMAHRVYRQADPAVWCAQRGYNSGNLNMTITAELIRGVAACAIPEHPMAREWYRKAESIMELLLDNTVAASGESIEPVGRHGRVVEFLTFAIVSTRSGLRDYVNDPRLKRLMLYFAKLSTPRDPRPRGIHNDPYNTPYRRYLPPAGRDPLTAPAADLGMMARFTHASDPQYSAQLQWAWLEHGASYQYSGLGGGFEYVYCDKRLPAEIPDWISEVFPRAGAILRHGLGNVNEHQAQLYIEGYPSQIGSLSSIFAYGVPVAGSFAGSYEWQYDERLICNMTLAQQGPQTERKSIYGYSGPYQGGSGFRWQTGEPARFGECGGWANVSRFAALPLQDYAAVDMRLEKTVRGNDVKFDRSVPAWPEAPAHAEPPVDRRRQLLFIKDADPAAAGNYLLIRDTVRGVQGEQPTMWQMWTVSEMVDIPERLRDVSAALAGKPGDRILPARKIEGNRFTALGQLGVDVEYYVASPSNTPRHTLRWGLDNWDPAGTKLKEPEYQDLLHLQMPGDGAYFVAFYPRKRDWPAPVFSILGDGQIIKVSGEFGVDYGFLSAQESGAAGEEAVFSGTVGSVQDRAAGLLLSLGAAGEVRYRDYGLASKFAASLRIAENVLTVELPEKIVDGENTLRPMIPFPGGALTVIAPGDWAIEQPAAAVTLTRNAAGFVLDLSPGSSAVTIVKKM